MTTTSTSTTISNIDIQTIVASTTGNFLKSGSSLVSSLSLYANGAWALPNIGSLSSNTGNGGTQTFSVNVVSALFSIPLDTAKTITFQVTAQVSYLGGKKRYIETTETVQTTVLSQQEYASFNLVVKNGSSSMSVSIVLCLAVLMFFIY